MLTEFWSLVSVISLAGWIASILVMIFRAFPERNVFIGREACKWGGTAFLLFAVWLIGMVNA